MDETEQETHENSNNEAINNEIICNTQTNDPTESNNDESSNMDTLEEDTENTPEIMCSVKKTKKRIIIDSESENEDDNPPSEDITNKNQEDESPQSKPALNDSDSEDCEEKLPADNKDKKKSFKLIDSDSEPEPEQELVEENTENAEEAPIYTVNDKKELVPERSIADGLAALCDPESSEDEDKQIKPLAYRKKPKQKGEEPEEKQMTAKEAAEQRKEIESVSQRMVREANVSLPYHKPKQRSLKEFLQNRPRFASMVAADGNKVPAAVAIKMSREQLDIVSKKMQEREKQVIEFYKSESEEEEETEKNEPDTVEIVVGSLENCDNIDENAKTIENIENNELALEETKEDTIQTEVDMETNILVDSVTETNEIEPMEETNELNESNKSIDKANNTSVELQFNISDSEDEETTKTNLNTATDETTTKKTALQLLKEQLANTQPKLSGAPNYVIDLEEGTTHLDEVNQLMQRFAKHTTKKPLHKKPSAVELNIMCVSQGGEIHKERVAVKVEEHEEHTIEEKPGVKYQKLRNELQTQMAQRRNELWKEKQARLQAEKEENAENADDDVYKGEKDDCGIDDILDDEEEEFSDLGSDADEYEEDDDEDNEEEKKEQGMIVNEASEVEDEEDDDDNDGNENEEVSEEEKEEPKKAVKQHKRIVQPDSDSEDEQVENTDKCLDSTVSWPDDDDLISAGQTNSCRTPNKQSCMQTKSELGFLSPICRLTGLQSFDATGKFLQNSPGSPAIRLGEPSPFKRDVGWSKSLFTESPLKSTENLEEICSGTFPTQPTTITANDNDKNVVQSQIDIEPSTQDMLELCSGNFDFTQAETTDKTSEIETTEVAKVNIEKETKVVDVNEPVSEPIKICPEKAKEVQIDDDDNQLISQLIDEDELETFKKKFESPLQAAHIALAAEERIAKKIAFNAMNQVENEDITDNEEDDDDDEDQNVQMNISRRRKNNKIMDSDEEDAYNHEKDDENIDLHDNDDEDNDSVDNPVNPNLNETELGYDSEENEILVEKSQKPKKMNLKDFLENEAELSESEWGSADEDEQNLDEMEFEEGDKEQFDNDELRSDLEKIHLRRMLDADKKDLKVLQELYCDEDEELKGAGRQRQFRWRNIDNVDNDESTAQEGENFALHEDDGENEEEWRKKRYERELFLQSQKEDGVQDDDTNVPVMAANSQLFKLGQRAVIKNKRNLKKTTQHVNIKQAYVLNTQRGSFLSRKDEVLTRVAEYAKVNDVVLGVPKNSRNFVFHAKISEENASTSTSTGFEDKKRKAGEVGTPAQLKRLRLNGFSPADQKKKAEARSKARLFSNKNSNQW